MPSVGHATPGRREALNASAITTANDSACNRLAYYTKPPTDMYIQGGPKSKPLPDDQSIVLNRIKICQ